MSVVPSIPIQKSISLQTTLFWSRQFLGFCVRRRLLSVAQRALLLRFRKKTSFLQIRQFFTSFNIWISCQHIPPVHCIFFVRTIVKVSPLRNYKESNPRNLGTSNNTEVVCTHHYNPPCAGGGLEAQYGGTWRK